MTRPEFLQQLVGKGEALHLQKQYEKAVDLYDMVLTQEDTAGVHPQVLYLLGTMYSEHNKNGIAKTLLELAIEKGGDRPEFYNNLGIVYKSINDYEKAKEMYAKALRLDYSAMTLANMSGLYINVAEPDKAYDIASRAWALEQLPQAGNHMALASLEMCKWEQGFNLYENRFNLPQYTKRDFGCPKWDGTKVGKLVVHGEQGLGDEVMFMSTLPLWRHLADEIVVECAGRLKTLFERSFGLRCYATEKEVKESGFQPDAWAAMGSLPLLSRVWEHWEERDFPYLKAENVPEKKDFRLGFSWRGGTNATHDVLRNFGLNEWKPLIALPGDHISLQYGPAEEMAKKFGLPHDSETIADVDKLSALIASCDAVVTVCNTSVHLAGALDVPCYVLCPHKKAWRYATQTERMRWYRSVVLIQQADGEPWSSVVERTIERLHADYGRLQEAQRATA